MTIYMSQTRPFYCVSRTTTINTRIHLLNKTAFIDTPTKKLSHCRSVEIKGYLSYSLKVLKILQASRGSSIRKLFLTKDIIKTYVHTKIFLKITRY